MFLLCAGQTFGKTLHHHVFMLHNKSYSITDHLIARPYADLMVMEAVSQHGPRASQQSSQGMGPAGCQVRPLAFTTAAAAPQTKRTRCQRGRHSVTVKTTPTEFISTFKSSLMMKMMPISCPQRKSCTRLADHMYVSLQSSWKHVKNV